MITGLAILLGYALLHIIEAHLETIVIKIKDYSLSNYNRLNKQEHYWSGVFAAVIFSYIVILLIWQQDYWLIASTVVTRRIFFDFHLHIKLKYRPVSQYQGNDWWVNHFFKPIFGKRGRVREFIFTLIIWIAGIVLFVIN